MDYHSWAFVGPPLQQELELPNLTYLLFLNKLSERYQNRDILIGVFTPYYYFHIALSRLKNPLKMKLFVKLGFLDKERKCQLFYYFPDRAALISVAPHRWIDS